MRCYVIRSTKHPERNQRSLTPKGVWWTISRNNSYILSRCVITTKSNWYLPRVLTSLKISNSGFHKLVKFWMWRHHGTTLWRHGGGPWLDVRSQRQLATSTVELMLLITWLDFDQQVIRKMSNGGSRASYAPYHCLDLSNHGIKDKSLGWNTCPVGFFFFLLFTVSFGTVPCWCVDTITKQWFQMWFQQERILPESLSSWAPFY